MKALCRPQHLTQIILNVLTYLTSACAADGKKIKLFLAGNYTQGKAVIMMGADGFSASPDSEDTFFSSSGMFGGDRAYGRVDLAVAEKLAKNNQGTLKLEMLEARRVIVLSLTAG
jgi:hypothetical protein